MIVLKYLSKKMLDKWNKTDGLMCAKKITVSCRHNKYGTQIHQHGL